ncbi:hypothetical protein [Burkholderia latens]|uniref:hypothetical protein n=1 Tax=Burkholderia latens TaxID=488446 RepID=UPI001AE572B2|nr:hypothetical protein [Burkholderia latens]QTO45135.1 hypothetical protein J8I85_22015 [Burkholderia latens]
MIDADIKRPVACIDGKVEDRRLAGSVPSNRIAGHVRDEIERKPPSRCDHAAFPCRKRENLADRRSVGAYPCERRDGFEMPSAQRCVDGRGEHAVRSIQRHAVERVGVARIVAKALYPVADAHCRHIVSAERRIDFGAG